MKAAAFDYHRARDVPDAISALAKGNGDTRPLAGGCSLGPMLNLRLARPATLVDLRAVAELREISRTRDGLIVGACRTHAEIEDAVVPDVTRGFMRTVAKGIAYRPIRNRGTIGGSLAHADPAADWVNALVALDATVLTSGAAGEERHPVVSFVTGAYATTLGESRLVTGVFVPSLSDAARWSYEKICRKTGEFALAIGAAVIDPARGYARVVCGAVEAAPIVLRQTSAALARDASEAIAVAEAEVNAVLATRDLPFRRLHAAAVQRAISAVKS
jgi:carbon-monoxide dehydrogenase medium subunit